MVSDEDARKVSEYFSSPETEVSWVTPLHQPESFKTLRELPSQYDEPSRKRYHIADYGCGDGSLFLGTDNLDGLVQRYPGAHITGYDFSTKHAEQAATDQGVDEQVTFVDGNMQDTLKDADLADWGYGINVLHAADDPEATLNHMYDNLKDDGYLILTVPGEEFFDEFPDNSMHTDEETGLRQFSGSTEIDGNEIVIDQYLISQEDAEQLYDRTGFAVIDQTTVALDDEEFARLRQHTGVPAEESSGPSPPVDLYVLQKQGD